MSEIRRSALIQQHGGSRSLAATNERASVDYKLQMMSPIKTIHERLCVLFAVVSKSDAGAKTNLQ